MIKKLRKVLIWIVSSFIGITIIAFSFLFYTYKSYSKYIDTEELDKYSLRTKLTETANLLKQGLHDRYIYRDYISSLDINPNHHVLDFGTGWGNDAVFIAERLSKESGKLTCLDIDNFALSIAKKRLDEYENISFICGDITKLDIPENTYDAIVVYFVFHCIDRELLEATINELNIVLKKGGKLFVREPLSNSAEHSELLTTDEIHNLMVGIGFKEISLVSSLTIDGIYQK